MYLLAINWFCLLSLGLIALLYRNIAKGHQRQYEMQRQRADAAEAALNNRQQLDTELENIHEVHREETIHAKNPAHLAERADFNNNWSGPTGLPSEGPASDHVAASATTAESTGTAEHYINRPDLS